MTGISIDDQHAAPSITTYLKEVISGLDVRPLVPGASGDHASIAAQVFAVLTSRDFCYLGKARAAVYRDEVVGSIVEAVRRGDPIRFFFDIGGGYHASIRPGEEDLLFDVGLAELLVLRQIADFATRVSELYAGGVRFSLVIDNMCALLVNDIPLEKTEGYCAALRELIRSVGVGNLVDVLVESEHFSVLDFERERARGCDPHDDIALTPKHYENVWRFLGRSCDEHEVSERVRRYREVIDASERLLTPLIQGVHLTQRATRTTLCFRPFRGGDSRIQCGTVGLTRNNKGKLCPVLLTTSNLPEYVLHRYCFPGLLPTSISSVTYAEPMNLSATHAPVFQGDASARPSVELR